MCYAFYVEHFAENAKVIPRGSAAIAHSSLAKFQFFCQGELPWSEMFSARQPSTDVVIS